jgi:hypothetical protein
MADGTTFLHTARSGELSLARVAAGRAAHDHREAAKGRVHLLEVEFNEDCDLIQRAGKAIAEAARCIAELTRNGISGDMPIPEPAGYLADCMREAVEYALTPDAAILLDAEITVALMEGGR